MEPKEKRGGNDDNRFWLILEEGWGRSDDRESACGVFWGPDWWLQEFDLH